MSVQLWPNREQFFRKTVGNVLGVILLLIFFLAAQHHDRRPGHDHRKQHFDPRAKRQQTGTDRHENQAEDDGADDAPVQNTVTQRVRDLEPGKDRHEHEQVVDAEDFFQRVTGHEQAGHAWAVGVIQVARKGEGDQHPEHRPDGGVGQRDRFIAFVGKQVDCQSNDRQSHKYSDGSWRKANCRVFHDVLRDQNRQGSTPAHCR